MPASGSTTHTLLATPRSEVATALACSRPGSSLSVTTTTSAPRRCPANSSRHLPAPPELQVSDAARSRDGERVLLSLGHVDGLAGGDARKELRQTEREPRRIAESPEPAAASVRAALAEVFLGRVTHDLIDEIAALIGVVVSGDELALG